MSGCTEQENGQEPFVQRRLAAHHNGANGWMSLIFTVLTHIGAFTLHAIETGLYITFRTV